MVRTTERRGGRQPRHVAWVWTRAEREDGAAAARVLRALVEHATECEVQWLTVQIPEERLFRDALDHLELPHSVTLVGTGAGAGAGAGSPAPRTGASTREPEAHGVPGMRLLLTAGESGRSGFIDALERLAETSSPSELDEKTIGDALVVPDVDLLVLTGADRHLPDLLLWQVVYSEIVVIDDPWPVVGISHFEDALDEYARRERRYGGLASSR